MIIDGRTIESGTAVRADCAIVGAGAAGITLGMALAKRGVGVCLIESGGLEHDPVTQDLYGGTISGSAYLPLDQSRLRYLGGTTNHWGGWCRPLDGIDFERRDWVPFSGWPIARSDLDPYYVEAQALCELGSFEYDRIEFWLGRAAASGQAVESLDIRTAVFQFSPPTLFGERYKQDLQSLADMKVLLNSTVVGFETNPDTSLVSGLRVVTASSSEFRVVSPVCVLAAGGIENARLLLLPTPARPHGLGNDADLVGRFFMDHPILPNAATIVVRSPDGILELFGDRTIVAGSTIRACLAPTDRYLRTRRGLNFLATVGPVAYYRSDGVRVVEGNRSEDGPQLGYRLLRLTRDLDIPPRSPNRPPGVSATEYSIGISCEVEPNPNNRVTLSDQLDALGVPRIHLHWRPSSADRASLHAGLMAIGQSLTAQRLGRFRLTAARSEEWSADLVWGCHHSGTTRMSREPTAGVVNRDCRVHGLGNLYVMGSSVFPTVGAANPTLTIVALALRLADILTERTT